MSAKTETDMKEPFELKKQKKRTNWITLIFIQNCNIKTNYLSTRGNENVKHVSGIWI